MSQPSKKEYFRIMPARYQRVRSEEDKKVIGVLKAVWEAAGYPWSARLKALLLLRLVWIRLRFALTADQERQARWRA